MFFSQLEKKNEATTIADRSQISNIKKSLTTSILYCIVCNVNLLDHFHSIFSACAIFNVVLVLM